MNIEFTKKVIEALTEQGALRSGFDMNRAITTCGTAGCIAGTACLVYGDIPSTLEHSIIDQAQNLFDINDQIADKLFYPFYIKGDWERITPDQAIEVLEMLIKDPTRVQWNKISYLDEDDV